jgi:hypothetical protein
MENLSEDCVRLILEKAGKDKVIKLACYSLDFLINKPDSGDACLYSSLSRFLFGIKTEIVRVYRNTCEEAASGGHLEVLKYAHENGCPWNELICANAARYGHLEVLKYLHQNGCPGEATT